MQYKTQYKCREDDSDIRMTKGAHAADIIVVDIMSNIREAVKSNGIDGSASCRPNNFLPTLLSTAASAGTQVMNI